MQYFSAPRSVPSLSQSVVPLTIPHPAASASGPHPSRVGRPTDPAAAPIPRPPSRRDARAAPPPLRPPSASHRQLSPPASHTIIIRLFIQILYLISKYTGDHERFTLSCSIEQSFFRTVVVHASVTGSRGPRVGRGSRLAGPRPGAGGLAGPGPRARRASRRGRGRTGTSSPSPPRSWPRSRRRPPMSCSRSRPPPPGGAARGSPARRGSSRVSRAAAAAAFGPGMTLDVLPGCARPGGRRRRRGAEDGVRRGLGGGAGRGDVRVGPDGGPRARPQARRGGRAGPAEPRGAGPGVHRATRSRTRWGSPGPGRTA